MLIFHDIQSYRSWRMKLNQSPDSKMSIGFVPTMGALHSGHAELLKQSVKNNACTVLSIFVNPTQFAPNEDLSKYPRTLESDLEIARKCHVTAVFVPTVDVLYPEPYSTYVTEETLSKPLCGVYRPTHFKGVTTIVLKLFNIIEPHIAYFGLKDAQQFYVIQQMVQDLNMNLKIEGVATIREPSGLALSSRNVYLSESERQNIAPLIYQQLQNAKQQLSTGISAHDALNTTIHNLTDRGFKVQYLELKKLPTFEDQSHNLNPLNPGHYLLAIAAYLGSVRLIDNVELKLN